MTDRQHPRQRSGEPLPHEQPTHPRSPEENQSEGERDNPGEAEARALWAELQRANPALVREGGSRPRYQLGDFERHYLGHFASLGALGRSLLAHIDGLSPADTRREPVDPTRLAQHLIAHLDLICLEYPSDPPAADRPPPAGTGLYLFRGALPRGAPPGAPEVTRCYPRVRNQSQLR